MTTTTTMTTMMITDKTYDATTQKARIMRLASDVAALSCARSKYFYSTPNGYDTIKVRYWRNTLS